MQRPRAADETTLRANFAAEHEIGRRFRIDPASLPSPGLERSVRNGPRAVSYAGQRLNVPPVFTATPFATGIRNPRRLLVLPNGDVLVAKQSEGEVLLLRDNGSGRAASRERYAGGFNGPYGLAWRDDELLVADQDGIWRVPGQGARPVPVTRSGVFGADRGHNNRPIAIDPRSFALFAGVGSMGNIAVEPEPRRRSSVSTRTDRTRRATPPAPATRRRSRFTRRPANCGPGCRSATVSATICRPIT